MCFSLIKSTFYTDKSMIDRDLQSIQQFLCFSYPDEKAYAEFKLRSLRLYDVMLYNNM